MCIGCAIYLFIGGFTATVFYLSDEIATWMNGETRHGNTWLFFLDCILAWPFHIYSRLQSRRRRKKHEKDVERRIKAILDRIDKSKDGSVIYIDREENEE